MGDLRIEKLDDAPPISDGAWYRISDGSVSAEVVITDALMARKDLVQQAATQELLRAAEALQRGDRTGSPGGYIMLPLYPPKEQ